MKKLLMASAVFGVAAMGFAATGPAAMADPDAGTICQEGYYYSPEQPEWSKHGVPCWKPSQENPALSQVGPARFQLAPAPQFEVTSPGATRSGGHVPIGPEVAPF